MERTTKVFVILTLLLGASLVGSEGGRDTPIGHGHGQGQGEEEVYNPQALFGLGGLGGLGLALGLGLGLPFGLGGFPGFGLLPWLEDGKTSTRPITGGDVIIPKGDGKGATKSP